MGGELIEATDFNGQTTRYEYDLAGRLVKIDYPNDADVSYHYDAHGEGIGVQDCRGQSTVQFDNLGRTVQVHDANAGLAVPCPG